MSLLSWLKSFEAPFGSLSRRLNNIKEQYTPPASQQQQRKYSTNQQLIRLKKEPKGASKLLSRDIDDI